MPSGWSTPSAMVDAIGNGRRHSERTTPPMDEPVLSESEGRCPYESAEWKEERSSHPEGRAATSWPCVHDQRKPNTTVPWTSQQGGRFFPIIRHNGFNFEKYSERIDSAERRSLERKAVRDTHVSAGRPMAGRRVGRKSEQFMPADNRQKLRVLSDK